MIVVRSAILTASLLLATVVSCVVILPLVSAAQESLEDALRFHEDAHKLYEQGRYDEAEQLYKRALAIYQIAPDLFQKIIAVTLNNLAEIYKAQGRFAEAELLHKQSWRSKRRRSVLMILLSLPRLIIWRGFITNSTATPRPNRFTSVQLRSGEGMVRMTVSLWP